MHQMVGNILCTLLYGHPIQHAQETATIVDNALVTTMHTLHASVSCSLNFHSPGSLAFHCDMFLNIPFQADLMALQQKCQLLIDDNLLCTNSKQCWMDYIVGQNILIKNPEAHKLGLHTIGPFLIKQVHANGTVTIHLAPNVRECINIRQIVPLC